MAKKKTKKTGIGLNGCIFTVRSIAIDNMGIPWVIDPDKGTIAPASTDLEPKQSAVRKRK